MDLRKATVRELFPSLISTISITEELSTCNSCGISTVAVIFLPLYWSLLSLKKNPAIAHDRAKLTEELVVIIQPVVQSRKLI